MQLKPKSPPHANQDTLASSLRQALCGTAHRISISVYQHIKKISPLAHYHISTLILSMMLVGCFGNGSPKVCKYKAPVAVFAGIEGFEKHQFEVKEQDAVERVSISPLNMDIELYQSGCDFLQQEFRFILHGTYDLNTLPEDCAMDVAMIFYELSQIDPKLGLFLSWAEALKLNAKAFKYNEKIPLENMGVTAQIDKTHQPESAVLSIILAQ